ncbi:MAG: carboxypeptidase-like regulatory domain-containing protein, partial [Planctomycetota bacterium]
MSRSRHSSLLLVLLLMVLGAGGTAGWMVLGSQEPIESSQPALGAPQAVPSQADTADRTALASPQQSGRQGDALTSVEAPLILELQQVQRGTFGDPGELLPPGSGANARLKGRLRGDRGDGLPGTVTFIAGPNQGRELRTDSAGRFGASDLYQGLSIVHVETDTGIHSERELLLRQLSTTDLNLELGRREACMVRGIVRDRAGKPLQGAEVRLDGGVAISDDLGEFYFPRVAPGTRALLVVDKKGYSRLRQTLPITRGSVIQADKLIFELAEGADLRLSVAALVGAPGPSYVYIFPVGGRPVNSQFG